MCTYARTVFECKHHVWGRRLKLCPAGDDFRVGDLPTDCCLRRPHGLHSRRVPGRCSKCRSLDAKLALLRVKLDECRRAFITRWPAHYFPGPEGGELLRESEPGGGGGSGDSIGRRRGDSVGSISSGSGSSHGSSASPSTCGSSSSSRSTNANTNGSGRRCSTTVAPLPDVEPQQQVLHYDDDDDHVHCDDEPTSPDGKQQAATATSPSETALNARPRNASLPRCPSFRPPLATIHEV